MRFKPLKKIYKNVMFLYIFLFACFSFTGKVKAISENEKAPQNQIEQSEKSVMQEYKILRSKYLILKNKGSRSLKDLDRLENLKRQLQVFEFVERNLTFEESLSQFETEYNIRYLGDLK